MLACDGASFRLDFEARVGEYRDAHRMQLLSNLVPGWCVDVVELICELDRKIDLWPNIASH